MADDNTVSRNCPHCGAASTVMHTTGWLERLEASERAHRAVCPARPIEASDLVSWDLVDGLTRAACLERWLVNRSEQEIPSGCKRPVYDLTTAQIEAGRRGYQACLGRHVRLLRAKVAASAEAERRRVLVDLQDLD